MDLLGNSPITLTINNLRALGHLGKELFGSIIWYLPGIITDPFNIIFTYSVYTAVFIFWTILAYPLAILYWFGVITRSNPILWPDPNILERMGQERISVAKSTLAISVSNLELDHRTRRPVGQFSIDVAQLLLLMSTVVQTRDSDGADEAEALALINATADNWGMKFYYVANLVEEGGLFRGPYCGFFVQEGPRPFVVVTFKGTTPLDFADWTGDFNITRTVAPFLDGRVHKGMYDRLFPDLDVGATRLHPYGEIIRTLKKIIEELGGSPTNKVPVWVTGHSLGAALASLFMARLLKSPGDLGDSYQLMDCYNYGCPILGESNFAIAVESNQNIPFDRYSVIWRVIDDADFVTRLLHGNEDINIISRLDIDAVPNYAHIGVPIRLYWVGTEPAVYSQFYSTGIKVEMITDNGEIVKKITLRKVKRNFVRGLFEMVWYFIPTFWTHNYDDEDDQPPSIWVWLARLAIPKYFVDHFPHRYYESLEKARKHTLSQGNSVSKNVLKSQL